MKNQNLAYKRSNSIAKTKPNPRVVQTQTPEIMEIESADFKKIAQSLTGKSTANSSGYVDKFINSCSESPNSQIYLEHELINFSTYCSESPKSQNSGSKNEVTTPKKRFFLQNTNVAKGSHSISKKRSVLRVVHTQTPEVIEAKPADFQKLVQYLTGKSTGTNFEEQTTESLNTEIEILNEFPSPEYEDRGTREKNEMTRWVNLKDESLIRNEDVDKFINELVTFPLFPLE